MGEHDQLFKRAIRVPANAAGELAAARMTPWPTWAMLQPLMLALLATPDVTPAATRLQGVLGKIYGHGDLQRELPTLAGTVELAKVEETWFDQLGRFLEVDLTPLAPVLRVLAYGGALLSVFLLTLWLARRMVEGEADALESERSFVVDDLGPRPLQDAAQAAAEGRYEEAIHLLLLRTFEELLTRSGARLWPGLTSRELVHLAPCPEAARPALAELVGAVETCSFAGMPASEADYLRCEGRFRALEGALKARPG